MSDWWLSLIGVDPQRIPEGAQTHFVFDNAPQSWMVFVMLALVCGLIWGVFFMYRREMAAVPRRMKVALATVRSLVILLVVFALLGPALAIATQRIVEPFVVVLVDESQSIAIRDRYPIDAEAVRVAQLMGTSPADLRSAPPQRAQVVNRLLDDDDARLLRELSTKGKIRVLSFARDVKLRQTLGSTRPGAPGTPGTPASAATPGESADPRASDDQPMPAGLAVGEPVPPLKPTGQATNLARAIRESLRSLAGNPVAGIVVISDGQNTEGDDPLSAADFARSQNVPIYTIGIGDSSVPRNLKVAQVWAPDSVFREDPFLIEAQIAAEGYDGRVVPVDLLARPVLADGSSGAQVKVASQNVTLDAATPPRVRFEHKPERAGDYVFVVRVPRLDDEVLETDNEKSAAVKVLSDKARVLLVAGAPSWEYRMLSNLLIRDKTTDVSCWLQSMDADMKQSGNTVIEKLPATKEELFKYDVLVLLDPDPEEFNEAWVEAIQTYLTDHAGGMLWMAGPKFTPRFVDSPRTRRIRDVLPVSIGELSALDVESLVMTHTKQWPLRITATGSDHPMLRLDEDPAVNRAIWDAMPGIYWSFPARAAKPGNPVLIEHTDPRLRNRDGQRPLLVAGQYGPGRTVFVGFNGTWRWRKLGEQYFDQFWVQTIRYLVEGRLMGEKKRGRISTDRDIYPVGARVSVSAKLFDAVFNPLDDPTIPATLRGPGGQSQTFELRAIANKPGEYEGSFIVGQVGLNEIVVKLPGGEQGSVRVAKQITAEVPRIEYADPRLNRQLLRDLAQRTEGAYFEIDEVADLPDALPMRSETIVIQGRPAELWDTSRLLILLVILLTLEWALRKRLKLM